MISRILKTKTVLHSATSIVGTLINGVFGVIFYIILARTLSTEEYGVFSIVVTTIALLASIANVGTDTGIVNFTGSKFEKDKKTVYSILKLALEIKIIVWFVLIAVGWFVMGIVANNVLNKPELTFPLQISLLGVGSTLLFSFSNAALQSQERFFTWALLNSIMNILRLVILLFLLVFGLVTLYSGAALYIVFPLFGFFISLLFIPNFFVAKGEWKYLTTFLKYNGWVAFFTIITAVSSRLDTYITTRLLTLSEVGVYSVAVSLSGLVSQIVLAVAIVAAPKLSSFATKGEAIAYLKKLQLMVFSLAVLGCVAGVPFGYYFLKIFYGEDYLSGFSALAILICAQAIFLFSVPVHTSILYYFKYPKFFVLSSVVNIIYTFIAGSLLIEKFGIEGAALTVFFGMVINFVIPAIWVVRKFRQ